MGFFTDSGGRHQQAEDLNSESSLPNINEKQLCSNKRKVPLMDQRRETSPNLEKRKDLSEKKQSFAHIRKDEEIRRRSRLSDCLRKRFHYSVVRTFFSARYLFPRVESPKAVKIQVIRSASVDEVRFSL